jgi:hypothetical protein
LRRTKASRCSAYVTRLAVVVLADVMSGLRINGEDPSFLIKGGTAMMLRFVLEESRYSKDLDGAVGPFVAELRQRGREPFHGFTFEVTKD